MNRVLDTNVCIDVLRGRQHVLDRLLSCHSKECFISSVTEFELFQGAGRGAPEFREEEMVKVVRFISAIQSLPFDRDCARIAGEINARLLNRGTPVGILDVLIAATCLRYDGTLVTNNTRDFEKIGGLTLEDWRS